MNLEEYAKQIKEWEEKYGSSKGEIKYDPSEVSVVCKRCKKIRRRMSRHHKANDFMWAMILPDVYAKRYLEFRKEDCDKLCERCHKYWHTKMKPLISRILTAVELKKIRKIEITEEWCEARRKEILMLYNSWLTSRRNNGTTKKKRNRRKNRRIRRSGNAS